MIIRLNAAMRRQGDHHERGAATLEVVGMFIVAALLAAALLLAAMNSAPVVGDKVRQAICMIVTLGQGDCEAAVTSAEDHIPTAPCLVSADGYGASTDISFIVTMGNNEKLLVEELSNGKFRVTRGNGAKIGLKAGVGFDVTATVDGKKYGAAAGAKAGVALTFAGGEVFYADNADGLKNLLAAHAEDVAKDKLAGNWGPQRWIVDRIHDTVSDVHNFPPPDEIYIEGGSS